MTNPFNESVSILVVFDGVSLGLSCSAVLAATFFPAHRGRATHQDPSTTVSVMCFVLYHIPASVDDANHSLGWPHVHGMRSWELQ